MRFHCPVGGATQCNVTWFTIFLIRSPPLSHLKTPKIFLPNKTARFQNFFFIRCVDILHKLTTITFVVLEPSRMVCALVKTKVY